MLTNPCQSVADEERLKQNEKEVKGNAELERKLERRLNGNEKVDSSGWNAPVGHHNVKCKFPSRG